MSYQRVGPPFTGVVRHLVIINVLMFFGSMLILGERGGGITTTGQFSLGRSILAAYMPGSPLFSGYQIFTHMFMHEDLFHIAMNMMGLYVFGSMVEMVMRPRRFLLYYILCGLGALLMHWGIQWFKLAQQGLNPSLYGSSIWGASGALYGILAAYAIIFPNHKLNFMFIPYTIDAKYFVPLLVALDLVFGLSSYRTGVGHFAHVGGAVTGFLVLGYWYRFRFR
jgi:membrane associated rhomboid family serine protease